MRLLPQSLFGRALLVLAAGLLVAQTASLVLNLFDRGSSVYRLAAFQIAARIAQTARILNRLPPADRPKIAEVLDGRHLRVRLSAQPVSVAEGFDEHDRYETAFLESVQRQIGAAWPVSVLISSQPRSRRAPGEGTTATPFEIWVARHFYYLLPDTFSIVAQVRLEDGSYAVFNAIVPQEPLNRLESLVPRLLLLVAVCFVLAGLLVYMITRSIERVARAADAIGDDPDRAPIAEDGPTEVRRVIAAFNRMQERIARHLRERTRMLGAISHDLRTPITRLRLRTEMVADAELRERMQRDLEDMEAMVRGTLEFFSDLGREPERLPVDVDALVESLIEDRRAAGETVTADGAMHAPLRAHPQALRRCIENLVENAIRYGGSAAISIRDSAAGLSIHVRDHGPGLPAEELERVFEPYVRLESSRNADSGGTGLGLSIARNIARWHGGDVTLANAPDGGLIARLTLPREHAKPA